MNEEHLDMMRLEMQDVLEKYILFNTEAEKHCVWIGH